MNRSRLISRLRDIDWDFAGEQSTSAFSSIHWYPARYVSQLAATLIGFLSDPKGVIFDPFVGSGTTLIEAQRLGRSSIGVDVNPTACRLVTAKTLPLTARQVNRLASRLQAEAEERLSALGAVRDLPLPPSSVQLTKWYTPKVRRDLRALWVSIRESNGYQRALGEAAFSSILLPVCRETRHWGYVCDNSNPTGDHEGDVLDVYVSTLNSFVSAYKQRDSELEARYGSSPVVCEAKVIEGDSRSVILPSDYSSVDAIITSPPYFGVTDYVKAQRLSMEWFDLPIEDYRQREIGARSKRHRLTAVEEYLRDIELTFTNARAYLRDGGYCAVVIGESGSRQSVIPDVREAIDRAGFSLVSDINRRVSSQRRQAPSVKGEHIMMFAG